jgi:signal transduction histidine kinase
MLGPDVRVTARGPLWIRAHRATLARALVDIVVHAREARRHGQGIEIAADGELGVVCLRIGGDGIGADPALLRLSTHLGASVDELGIRLWIARCALVSHGAVIEVANDFDEGTAITVALPTVG